MTTLHILMREGIHCPRLPSLAWPTSFLTAVLPTLLRDPSTLELHLRMRSRSRMPLLRKLIRPLQLQALHHQLLRPLEPCRRRHHLPLPPTSNRPYLIFIFSAAAGKTRF